MNVKDEEADGKCAAPNTTPATQGLQPGPQHIRANLTAVDLNRMQQGSIDGVSTTFPVQQHQQIPQWFAQQNEQVGQAQQAQQAQQAFGQGQGNQAVQEGQNSRQTPAPAPARIARNRRAVPIPVIQKSSSRDASAQPSGPMTRQVEVPQRPRPGRKPIKDSDSKDRRRKQNRDAQRKFRDKRVEKLSDTQAELERTKVELQEQGAEYHRELQVLRDEISQLKQQNAQMQMQLRGQITPGGINLSMPPMDAGRPSFPMANGLALRRGGAHGPFRPNGEGMTLQTPPLEQYTETNFTTVGRQGQGRGDSTRPSLSNDSTRNSSENPSANYATNLDLCEGPCGFCGDDTYCHCEAQAQNGQPIRPGQCDACQNDPTRADACARMAAFQPAAQPPPTSKQGPAMTCVQFMDQAKQQQVVESTPTLNGHVHPQPSTDAAFEIDEQEAADALSMLSQQQMRADQDS